MEFENIKEIIQIFDSSNIGKMCLENDDFKLSLEKNNLIYSEEPVQRVVERKNIVETPTENINKVIEKKEEDYFVFKAPLVGTFYAAPSPSSSPYVKVGDMVEVDQVICIIEAMKMTNEIKSPVKGKIMEILVSNEDLVEFDEAIFKIEASDV